MFDTASTMQSFQLSSRVSITADTLINVVGEESVLLNLKNEQYYGLDEIGTRMWQVLTSGLTIQQAIEQLIGEYDVDAARLQSDLYSLIEKLSDHGLVELDA